LLRFIYFYVILFVVKKYFSEVDRKQVWLTEKTLDLIFHGLQLNIVQIFWRRIWSLMDQILQINAVYLLSNTVNCLGLVLDHQLINQIRQIKIIVLSRPVAIVAQKPSADNLI
jgi:hypothetical protein